MQIRGAGTEFNRITAAIKIYKDRVASAVRTYARQAADVKQRALDYKDEKGYISENLAPLKETARKEIISARREFAGRMEEERRELEKLLHDVVTVLPDKSFIDVMRFYTDFAICPNKMEVGALLEATKGNALALRALNGWLLKSESGFRIAAVPFDDFAADLDMLSEMGRTFWTGTDYAAEVGELFNGTPRPVYKNGKETDMGYRWDATFRSLENAAFLDYEKRIAQAAERWAAEVAPRVEAAKPADPEKEKPVVKLPEVEAVKDSAEAFAKRTGAEQAAAEKLARDTIGQYLRH